MSNFLNIFKASLSFYFAICTENILLTFSSSATFLIFLFTHTMYTDSSSTETGHFLQGIKRILYSFRMPFLPSSLSVARLPWRPQGFLFNTSVSPIIDSRSVRESAFFCLWPLAFDLSVSESYNDARLRGEIVWNVLDRRLLLLRLQLLLLAVNVDLGGEEEYVLYLSNILRDTRDLRFRTTNKQGRVSPIIKHYS